MLAKTKIPIVIASWDDIAEVDKNLIRQDVLCNKQEDSWECGYYVMSWIRTIIQAVAKNEWIEVDDVTNDIHVVRSDHNEGI
ncbi:hypothetical protein DEO72_LG6g755 [Vigna unguiculata]|uniref:Ulp1 protease family n=1 Tax=Vigna unguiculata TaxID=3917 RepID=A0A4D6M5M2_VIGUN|nr:hypothetical protein DEO72_LG6g755 [Vigna unguiculata]